MLTGEEKRWMVVGICLTKVITPVIRTVVEQEMKQLYQNLIPPPNNIASQTMAVHFKCLPPSSLRLNYVNINNNASKKSHHNYDYGVRDEVSLARLFVKPFMAGFMAFDESLDSSAALAILSGAPNFVFRGVDTVAMDVRSDVRNEWGHCNFVVWTETHYLHCFQLMEDLIKRLNLPMAKEEKALQDLNDWKDRGLDICFGQALNKDLLELVQGELATLLKSVDKNEENWTQDYALLKTNLQNLSSLFGLEFKRLEAKHKSLETRLGKLKQDQLTMKDLVEENELATSTNASLIQRVRCSLQEEKQGLERRQEVLEGSVAGLSRGIENLATMMLSEFKTGLFWKIPFVIFCGFLTIFLYQVYSRGSMLRYWYCRRHAIEGHTLSFVFKTSDHQTPTVNGVEFTCEKVRKKLKLTCVPHKDQGVRYYLNIDRCAYGGVIAVSSPLDNVPQVRGAAVLAVNSKCNQVYYQEDAAWKPYISARKINCTPPFE